jgi:hypothetical protein
MCIEIERQVFLTPCGHGILSIHSKCLGTGTQPLPCTDSILSRLVYEWTDPGSIILSLFWPQAVIPGREVWHVFAEACLARQNIEHGARGFDSNSRSNIEISIGGCSYISDE